MKLSRVLNVGFTLIELLIVVAIIAILAAIAVPNFLEAQTRAKVSRARTDMRSIATGLEAYAVDNNKYPPVLGNAGPLVSQTENYRNKASGYTNVRTAGWRTTPQQLTTPVAYLSSIIPDVFKNGTTARVQAPYNDPDSGKPYTNGDPFDAGFIYQNIKQLVDAYNTPGSTTAIYNASDIAAYGQWRLMSIGPDKTYNALGSDNTADFLGWLYDSTNGTVSAGMLVRTQRDTQNTDSARRAGT
jgi:prepilin-type N-terminal cleavage/methylation domain-containing protein